LTPEYATLQNLSRAKLQNCSQPAKGHAYFSLVKRIECRIHALTRWTTSSARVSQSRAGVMMMNVVGNLRPVPQPQHMPQPSLDVAAAPTRSPVKHFVAKASARLSHAVFFGVIGLTLLPQIKLAAIHKISDLATPQPATSLLAASQELLALTPVVTQRVAQPAIVTPPAIESLARVAPPRLFAKTRTFENVRRVPLRTFGIGRHLPFLIAKKVRPSGTILIESGSLNLPTLSESQAVFLAVTASVGPRVLIKAKDRKFSRRLELAQVFKPLTPLPAPAAAGKTAAAKPDTTDAPANITVAKTEPYTVANVWSESEISEARAACGTLLQDLPVIATASPPMKEGSCGIPAPVSLRQLGTPKVQIQPPATLTCPMAASLHTWITDHVQPAAVLTFGAPVVRLISASSYVCRNRYGRPDTALSEHALGNALDLSGFILADGRTIRVLENWGPVARDAEKQTASTAAKSQAVPLRAGLSLLGGGSLAKATSARVKLTAGNTRADSDKASASNAKSRENEFLHRVHDEACEIFGTVLGPEANDAHRNHFHLDMKARRHKGVCQ
jgi:hypothetical protein